MGYINKGSLIYRGKSIAGFRNWVIVDLDGTLTDFSHRRHCLQTVKDNEGNPKANWDAFNEAAQNDPIKPNILMLVIALKNAGFGICIMTGRSSQYSRTTMDYIEQFGIPHALVLMREQGDFRSDVEVKLDLYNSHFRDVNRRVRMVLEDRDKVVEMWRSIGLTCLQVAKGEY